MRRGREARKARREAAGRRQEIRDSRSDEQQIRRLIRLGHGHCKEVTRLKERIEK